MAEGEFHESMNLAGLWELPVLFVCENNLYAMGTALHRSESQIDLTKKAASYNVETYEVDGMNVLEVDRVAKKVLDQIRETGKPVFLECKTFRFRAHSMFDPELYRGKAEVEEWKKKDPIATFREYLTSEELVDGESLNNIDNAAQEEVNEAIRYAASGTLEPVQELEKFVYSEEGRE